MLSYDQAVLMLAALASSSDGQPGPEESRLIGAHLAPVLRRLGADGQQKTMDLLRELLRGIGLDNTLSTLRAALPTPRDRLEAVRLAAAVAFADGRVRRAEADHVANLAVLLGLSEDEFLAVLPARAPSKAAAASSAATAAAWPGKAPGAPAGAGSREEATFLLAILAGSADGVPQDEEAQELAARLGPVLATLGPAGRAAALHKLTGLVEEHGLDGAAAHLLPALPDPGARAEALRVATSIVFADGRVTKHERAHLDRLASALGLPPPNATPAQAPTGRL